MKFGIDISHHNKIFDYEKAFSNIDFVIIRAGYGKVATQEDKALKQNVENAIKYKKPFGIYWYSYAKNTSDAKQEAETCISILKKYNIKPTFPVFFDIEDETQTKLSKAVNTEIVKTFCNTLKNAGYKVGFYTFHYFALSFLNVNDLEKYDYWYANCSTNDNELTEKYSIHQYTFKLDVAGISAKCDGDKMSDEYFNRYLKSTNETVTAHDALKILQKVVNKID